MFTTRDVPWMKVGTVIEDEVSAAEAMRIGGLDFEVKPEPAGYFHDDQWHPADGKVALVRQDTGEICSFATDTYEPVQYTEAFDFIDQINPRYVAAGALRGGRQGFLVAQLPEQYEINLTLRGKDDPHKLYVVLRTSQDLTSGIEIAIMTLREVCMNMLTLPTFTNAAKQRWSMRHTRNVRMKMQQAVSVITAATNYTSEFNKIAERLADIDLSFEQQKEILESTLPDKPRRLDQVIGILESLDLDTNSPWADTGWGLVNATNEYFEYLRPSGTRTVESQFTDGLDGAAHRYSGAVTAHLLSRYGG